MSETVKNIEILFSWLGGRVPTEFITNTQNWPKWQYCTLNKVQKICVILRRSENSFSLLQWLSMRKQFLKHKKMKKTCIPKIILHKYNLYKGDPIYVGTFPVNLRMALIFKDLPTGSGFASCVVLEICKYQRHPWVHWESSNIGQITFI